MAAFSPYVPRISTYSAWGGEGNCNIHTTLKAVSKCVAVLAPIPIPLRIFSYAQIRKPARDEG